MGKPIRVLFIDDSEDDVSKLVERIKDGGYEPIFKRIEDEKSLNAVMDEDRTWDIVISDYVMPGFGVLPALRVIKGRSLDIPVIVTSGSMGENFAVECMKAGARDYLLKNQLARLGPVIDRELQDAQIHRENRQGREMIRYISECDPLTALPNRTFLLEMLQQAIIIGQQKKGTVAFLLLDLDRFKEINDTLGHHRGDLILQQVGTRLKEVLWESDTVARMGGDEFAVLLPLSEKAHATLVARKIQKCLEGPFVVEDFPVGVEASIGIAVCPEHGTDTVTLFRHADVAMYNAKSSGSGYAIYDRDHDQYTPRQLALIGGLRQAIECSEFIMHYQPKISLKTRRIIEAEALIRWQHPEYGFIPPGQFIPPAERTGLIKPLTHWVLQQVCGHYAAWDRVGYAIPISANLSVRNLQDPQLPYQIEKLIQDSNLEGNWLGLEITESMIMSDSARAMEVLLKLNRMGIRLSIDDFGTGYSSLGYLKRLPVQEIKIDKMFIQDMIQDEESAVIVHSTIELGHNLGLTVVAEGVENKETLDQLTDLCCDTAQGFFISRPMPAEKLLQWMDDSPWGINQSGR